MPAGVVATGAQRRAPLRAGVGLRLPHLAEVAATRPAAGWFEIHPENFLANPHATELLVDIAGHYSISVHSVGISIGSASGVDRRHLSRVRRFIDLIDPVLVSGHLAWSTHDGEYLNDLLPLPYDEGALQLLCRHLDEVQTELGRPYLVENPSSYVGIASSTMDEAEFLGELACRTGCLLLCDVSNVYLSGRNLSYDPYAYIDALPRGAIAELHLGGFHAEPDGEGGAEVLIDTHGQRIADEAWELYGYAIHRFGAMPTLVEWDNDIPDLATVLSEAEKADAIAVRYSVEERRRAVAG
jgi:uncharacterized protein (UPF0276 family)